MKEKEIESKWRNLMLRLMEESRKTVGAKLQNNRQKGVAIITMHILMDSSGVPLLWVVPEGKRVEPTKYAADILRTLAEGVMEDDQEG